MICKNNCKLDINRKKLNYAISSSGQDFFWKKTRSNNGLKDHENNELVKEHVESNTIKDEMKNNEITGFGSKIYAHYYDSGSINFYFTKIKDSRIEDVEDKLPLAYEKEETDQNNQVQQSDDSKENSSWIKEKLNLKKSYNSRQRYKSDKNSQNRIEKYRVIPVRPPWRPQGLMESSPTPSVVKIANTLPAIFPVNHSSEITPSVQIFWQYVGILAATVLFLVIQI